MRDLIKATYRAPSQAIENHLRLAFLLTQQAENEANGVTERVRKANASKLLLAKRKARRLAEEHGRAEAKRELEAERKRICIKTSR